MVAMDVGTGTDTTVVSEVKQDGTIEVQSVTEEPTPVIETPPVTDITVAQSGPVEVDLSPIMEEKFIDIDTHEVVQEAEINHIINSQPLEIKDVTIADLEALSQKATDTIIQTRDEIDRSNEVVNYVDARKTPTYEEHVSDVNTTLQGTGNATTEDAYTYGITRLRNNKKPLPDDWIVRHIFGGSYDLWISEYIEDERVFFGFASFGGIFDQDAEWGYVSIDEILGLGFPKPERDFYWTPCTLQSLKDAEQKAYDQKEQAIQLGADVDEDEEPTEYDIMSAMFKDPNLIMMAGGYYY